MPKNGGKTDVVVAGHICLDIIPKFPRKLTPGQVFIPGRLTEVDGVELATGGAVSNTGQSLHRLGVPTKLMGKVGDDEFGNIILSLVKEMAPVLAKDMIVSKNEETSYSVVLNLPGVDRIFLHFAGTNHTYSMSDIDFDSIKGIKLFHFGYPPIMKKMYEKNGEELKLLLEVVKTAGIITSLDMAMPDPNGESGAVNWRKVLENTIPFVDMFFPSIEEILFMLNRSEYDRLMASGGCIPQTISVDVIRKVSEELLQMGGKIIGLKLGNAGIYLRTGNDNQMADITSLHEDKLPDWINRELWMPCFKVNVKGTTGAGDSTIAGFIAGFLNEKSAVETLKYAVGTGAFCVEEMDSTSGVPQIKELELRIKSNWPKLSILQDLKGWKFNEEHGVWYGPNDKMFIHVQL
jgi:sugar/nucleoside kinase (ribokinase family)